MRRFYNRGVRLTREEEGKLQELAKGLAVASGYDKPFPVSTVLRIIIVDYYQLWKMAEGEVRKGIAGRVVEYRERMDKDGE
jgi:hypothetical protein